MAQLSERKVMKPRVLVLTYIDWSVICGVIVCGVLLFIFPFWNYNRRALFYMAQKEYEKAEQQWRRALSKDTFSPLYRMNMALNYILGNQPEKAVQEYVVARNLVEKVNSSDKEEVLFYSFFNSAVAATQKRNIKQALGFYQQALVPRPESLEVKTNIELLVRGQQASSDSNEKKQSSEDNEQEKAGNQESREEASNQKNEEKEPNQKTGEKSEKEENLGSAGDNQKQEEKSETESSEAQKNKETGKQDLNEKQTEAILKAILDQEKSIRERRQRDQQRKPVVEKDW